MCHNVKINKLKTNNYLKRKLKYAMKRTHISKMQFVNKIKSNQIIKKKQKTLNSCNFLVPVYMYFKFNSCFCTSIWVGWLVVWLYSTRITSTPLPFSFSFSCSYSFIWLCVGRGLCLLKSFAFLHIFCGAFAKHIACLLADSLLLSLLLFFNHCALSQLFMHFLIKHLLL